MSWWVLIGAAFGAFACKWIGLHLLSRVPQSGMNATVVKLTPAAIFAAIVVTQLLGSGSADAIATRAVGVAIGAVAAFRRLPIPFVIMLAAGTTALLRAIWPRDRRSE